MSRYRVGINAGPVHVSRRVGGGKSAFGKLLALFIVKPLELLFKGIVALCGVRSRKNTEQAVPAYMPPGWYNTAYGPLYFNGVAWLRPDGRAF